MTIQAELDKLRENNKKLEELIKEDTIKLSDRQNQQKELRAQMVPLEKLANRITTSQSTLASHLEAAKKAGTEAEEFLKPLLSNLELELSSEIREQIIRGINASNEEIQIAKDQVDAQKVQIADAENSLVLVQNQLKESQAVAGTLFKQLQDLPQPVKDAQARVSKLLTEIRNSSTTGQTRKSYYLAVSLETELKQLNSLIKAQSEQEKKLLDQINQQPEVAKKVQKAVEDSMTDLVRLKAELVASEQALQQKERQREGQLTELLAPSLAMPAAT